MPLGRHRGDAVDTTKTPNSPARRWLSTLGNLLMAFPLLLFVGVLLFFVLAGIQLAWSNSVKQQNFVPMRVTIVDKRALQDIRRTGPNGRNRTVVYQPFVVYRYEVNGQAYESHRVWPERLYVDEEWAQEVLHQFKVGQVYDGYYDPNNPSDAFLIQDYNPAPAIAAGFALIIFVAIGTMFVRSLRSSRRGNKMDNHATKGW
jgi:hypothetical protein